MVKSKRQSTTDQSNHLTYACRQKRIAIWGLLGEKFSQHKHDGPLILDFSLQAAAEGEAKPVAEAKPKKAAPKTKKATPKKPKVTSAKKPATKKPKAPKTAAAKKTPKASTKKPAAKATKKSATKKPGTPFCVCLMPSQSLQHFSESMLHAEEFLFYY